ncbi:MAG: quinol:cytochrome C oxidoreductase [Bacteroidetes bacterium]|nr:quinol:cytochrome C oxidoreductase [Bacteroidota bacterium]MBT6687852.1 quinol:cytochrome C oxidoreductase [Bacteroidota bacterium]MBT7142080.1 quinol:cytochrome C oxidoreductase [Bacteroidota bacterium]
MDKAYTVSPKLRIASIILVLIGIAAIIVGFLSNPQRTWANYLINNYYFISLAIGATFFMAIQYITQSGWSSMFKRIAEAMGSYIPYAAVLLFIFVLFGAHSIYHWSHHDAVEADALLKHKSPYLNTPFFIIRYLIIFAVWIVLIALLRKFSLKEDLIGGMEYFHKSEFYSKVFIFALAVTFSFGTFDWIMSIDAHWFSTIFAIKNLVSAFLHGSAILALIVILLHKQGHFPMLNKSHLHDLSKYMFILGIIWAYMWFSQFLLIWYANMPEETFYYQTRISGEWKVLFYVNVILNWLFPFLFLMLNKIAKNINALLITAVVLMIGMWVDLYLQVMPGSTISESSPMGINSIGFVEIGMFLGFLGLFIFAVSRTLSKAKLIPENHPYIEESLMHELH